MGAVVTGLVLSSASISNVGETYPDEHAYMTVFVVMAFGSIAAFLTALLIPRRAPAVSNVIAATQNTDESVGIRRGG